MKTVQSPSPMSKVSETPRASKIRELTFGQLQKLWTLDIGLWTNNQMPPKNQNPALLALEDGRTFRGRSWAAEGEALRRDGLQHVDDRLSGSANGSFLCRPDCLHDVSADWQLRR